MTTARMSMSALWCDQGMAHMLQMYDTIDAQAPSQIVLVDFGAETMFKSSVLKINLSAPAVTKVVEALFLQQQAGLEPKLDYVLITHQDTDHWSLLNYLMDAVDEIELPMKVGAIIYGGSDWGAGALATVNRLAAYGVGGTAPITVLKSNVTDYADANGTVGSLVTIGDVVLRILIANAPIAKSSSSALRKNGTSAVVVIDYMAERMILPGDATWETLAAANTLLGAWTASPVQPVKVISAPHHGSLATMTPKNEGTDSNLEQLTTFTDLVRPEAVIASAGYENSFKHPYLIILKVLGKYAGSDGLGPHKVVVYRIDTSDWQLYTDITKNIYTTVIGLTSPVEVADYLFTRSEYGFFTEAFGFLGPSKAIVSVPSTQVQVLGSAMSTAMDEESKDDGGDGSLSGDMRRLARQTFVPRVTVARHVPPPRRVAPVSTIATRPAMPDNTTTCPAATPAR